MSRATSSSISAVPAVSPLDQLPHRDPFRFVTRLVAIDPGRSAEAVWSPTGREWFFAGHFPGDPIVPGVLIGEALAQVAGLAAFSQSADSRQRPPLPARLAQIDLKLESAVRPPAEITLRAQLSRQLGPLRLFDVVASSDGQRIARGTLTLADADPRPTEPAP